MQTEGKMQNDHEGYRPQTKGKKREKPARNTSVLIEVCRNLIGQNVWNFFSCSNRKVC